MAFYRKPSPETMKKRREEYKNLYSKEMAWFKENMDMIKSDKFLIDMYTIMITGSRPMSPKMVDAVHKAMKSPRFDIIEYTKRKEKIKPILEKINFVENLVETIDSDKSSYYQQNYSSLKFVKSLKKQLESKLTLSEKQMQGLNKVFKRYNNQLEKRLKKHKKNEKKA